MSKAMNIVVAYDGSECATQALSDLRYAGIPDGSNVTVISVSEWLPSLAIDGSELVAQRPADISEEAQSLAQQAADRLKEEHPTWHIQSEGITGSVAHGIQRRADELGAELIVVGSHGRSAIGRFMLGSVSHQLVSAVGDTNVRIARPGYQEHSEEPRSIMLAIDGSNYSESIINAVLARTWLPGTTFMVVSAAEYSYDEDEEKEGIKRLEALHHIVTERLAERGFSTRSVIDTQMTHPKRALLTEAEHANVGCIFIGARGLTGFERFVLGSVSTSVAMQAKCSVEIVYARDESVQ